MLQAHLIQVAGALLRLVPAARPADAGQDLGAVHLLRNKRAPDPGQRRHVKERVQRRVLEGVRLPVVGRPPLPALAGFVEQYANEEGEHTRVEYGPRRDGRGVVAVVVPARPRRRQRARPRQVLERAHAPPRRLGERA